jgi:hypothetical protein
MKYVQTLGSLWDDVSPFPNDNGRSKFYDRAEQTVQTLADFNYWLQCSLYDSSEVIERIAFTHHMSLASSEKL